MVIDTGGAPKRRGRFVDEGLDPVTAHNQHYRALP